MLFFFENYQNSDLSRISSHLVPYWHRFGVRVIKLAVSGLSLFWRRTTHRAICAHTSYPSFFMRFEQDVVSQTVPLFSSRLNDGIRSLKPLFVADLPALLVREVAGSSLKSRYAGRVDARLFKQPRLAGVIDGGFLSSLLPSNAIHCLGRKFQDFKPATR